MQGMWIGYHTSAVADHARIDPVLVHVTVEGFAPFSTSGEADAVSEPVKRRQVHDHDHVVTVTLSPTMECQDTILIMHMHHTKALSTQPG